MATGPRRRSYDGWNLLNYLAGELEVPGRNLPRCILWGMLLVITVTLLVNAQAWGRTDFLRVIKFLIRFWRNKKFRGEKG